MKLDIIPWCLFINGLGYDIKVVDLSKNQECFIQSNRIAIPMTITVYTPFFFAFLYISFRESNFDIFN